MMKKRSVICNRDLKWKGSGLGSSALSLLNKVAKHIPIGTVVNKAIDALPVELHLPGGYNYCGPGTKLQTRLARGDRGINPLDEACKQHDIAYSQHTDTGSRSIADKALAEKAWQRFQSSDASLGEKAASLAVATAMGAKRAVGGGSKKRTRKRTVRKGPSKKRRVGKKRVCRKQHRQPKKNGKGLYLKPYRTVY